MEGPCPSLRERNKREKERKKGQGRERNDREWKREVETTERGRLGGLPEPSVSLECTKFKTLLNN